MLEIIVFNITVKNAMYTRIWWLLMINELKKNELNLFHGEKLSSAQNPFFAPFSQRLRLGVAEP